MTPRQFLKRERKSWWFVTVKDKSTIQYCSHDDIIIEPKGSGFSRSIGYKSKAKLLEGEGILESGCVHCGEMVKTNNWSDEFKKALIDNNICTSCHFWNEKYENVNNPNQIVVKGVCYYMGPNKNYTGRDKSLLGFGGHEWKIKKLNSDEIIQCNNLWHNGEIPELWRSKIPNNAEFIT